MTIETKAQLAKYFDHTLLTPTAGEDDIRRLCDEAIRYGVCAACVQPRWVRLCADLLEGADVKVCSVAGFPFGTETPKIKAYQAQAVIQDGADEVDIVADLAAVIAGNTAYLTRDLSAVLKVCRRMRPAVLLKVIIESAALTDEQIRFVCGVAQDVGVDYIKTSTGFLPQGGATPDAVRTMAQAAPLCRIKAAGGIKTLPQTLAMIDAGAARIGASATPQILDAFHDCP